MNSQDMLFQTSLSETQALEFLFTRDIEFRQETIYFVILDRFHDGDPSNNPGPNPELYDPHRQDWGKYWGGDIQGLIDQLDYLKRIGVTAIWISPVFEQVEELQFGHAAMHGYWTKDFKRINPRFVPLHQDNCVLRCNLFDVLVQSMHDRGLKLILDIVCNHSSPDVNGQKGRLYDDGELIADFYNDVNHWYHHNGEITDWQDQWQLVNCEMAGLADFDENNPEFRHYIKTAIKSWLDRGVDALRIDTVKHMHLWFWQEFNTDIQTHKPSVFAFGEWGFSKPQDPHSVNFANKSGMSILDFGLCEGIRSALAENHPAGFYRIQNILDLDYLYNSSTELVTFIDNHDMPRFQSLNPDPQRLRLAVGLLMTTRGIPCIYYGTEQYLHNDTNGGMDPYNRPMMEHWDPDTQICQDLRLLSKLRRLNPAVSLGAHHQKYITPDIYCYVRSYRDSRCFVALNKGQPITLSQVDCELEDGEYICILTGRSFMVHGHKLYNFSLNSQEMIILNYIGDRVEGQMIVRAQLNGYVTHPGEVVAVIGDCPELGNWNVNHAFRLEYINANTWFNEIPFHESAGKFIAYKYVILREGQSPIYEEVICRRWLLAASGTVKWRNVWAVAG
ncbi:MAG: alpha-amylase family glycosyl hydrolase [Cyanobacteriota bacterium]|nr:alpha-amylase family glycosyl hydrolase [Cyanobacteriota bacterium]